MQISWIRKLTSAAWFMLLMISVYRCIALQLFKHYKGQHIICLNNAVLEKHQKKMAKRRRRIHPECLRWKPPVFTRDQLRFGWWILNSLHCTVVTGSIILFRTHRVEHCIWHSNNDNAVGEKCAPFRNRNITVKMSTTRFCQSQLVPWCLQRLG